MQKSQVLASLGQNGLLLPVWVKAALAANDRLKLYLTVLQAAASHAEHPNKEPLDLSRELVAAGLGSASWLQELPAGSSRFDARLLIPELDRLCAALQEDLGVMARPVLATTDSSPDVHLRVQQWQEWLDTLHGEQLTNEQLHRLTHGRRNESDSLHLLIMDLHKQINHLAADLASELIDGAHVWQLADEDRPRVQAFMEGLNRTAPLKFEHPGLDTAATRDGDRLLLQNDIGTNDAHVLVMQIEEQTITLTYSDLHRSRFAFYQALLAPLNAVWSNVGARTTEGLNQGDAYTVGTARFECADEEVLRHTLEGLGASIVFLIDWNRARKRLLPFVGKEEAVAILLAAARSEVGHMAWLKAGGDRLIWDAMRGAGNGAFQLGDRLCDVLGDNVAQTFLLDAMRLSCQALRQGLPMALVADETRLLLNRLVRQRTEDFDLLDEHAAYCHALAQAISDCLLHGHDGLKDTADELSARAKAWERRADHLVMQARDLAEHRAHWQATVRMLELSDDVSDALEEAAFLISLIADHHQKGWNHLVRQALTRLAQTVEQAIQDHIRALAIARTLSQGSDAADSDAFLSACWAVLRAERQCDEQLRQARRILLAHIDHAPSLMLANDLAMTLELASDRLLSAGYALRDRVFHSSGVSA